MPEGIQAKQVCVVGDFNNWDENADQMKKSKKVWKTTVELERDREYQFRIPEVDSPLYGHAHGSAPTDPRDLSALERTSRRR